MLCIFIGFDIKKGDFTNEKTGEVIPYSNRIIRYMTREGETDLSRGYSVVQEKVKAADLCGFLNVPKVNNVYNEDYLDDLLTKTINRPVELTFRPQNNVLSLSGFKIVKQS